MLSLILRQGLSVALVGLTAGCVLTAAATRLLGGIVYGVGLADPVSWGTAAILLLGVSALANLIPARRAARVDPSTALRTE